MTGIIGRKEELRRLQDISESSQAEFLAIYGRRRVGKTHLVRCFFEDRGPYLEVVGRRNGTLRDQINLFFSSLRATFGGYEGMPAPRSWREAFEMLTPTIKKTSRSRRFTLFLDELPWLATPRSGLVDELDYFWNARWSRIPNFNLVVCGSAASWMLSKLVNARGGLHNRLTRTIPLQPFDLDDTLRFLRARGTELMPYQVVEIYLAMGGIPYYLEQVRPGNSVAQTINETCFRKGGLLLSEFDNIFPALFRRPDKHLKIIQQVARRRYGVSRSELIRATNIPSGGALNRPLNELEAAGFITRFVPYGRKIREPYFKVTDEYTKFYLTWIAPFRRRGLAQQRDYWMNVSQTPSWSSWAGYAFEGICQKHADQILSALGISGVQCEVATWRHTSKPGSGKRGAQIDLLFDRRDGVVTLAEIKHSSSPFVVTRAVAQRLREKMSVFKAATRTRKAVATMVLISPFGTTNNNHAREVLAADLTLDALFSRSGEEIRQGQGCLTLDLDPVEPDLRTGG